MIGANFLRAVCIFAAGFAAAVLVGARNGDQMADREIGMLEACDELARFDRADCMQRLDTMASAVHALGDRCVLAVPERDNLRVARMPRGVMP
jgi:hypothetical protein